MDIEEKNKVEKNKVSSTNNNKCRCSSFDDDCKEVENPTGCFLGIGKINNIGIVDGYCPLINSNN